MHTTPAAADLTAAVKKTLTSRAFERFIGLAVSNALAAVIIAMVLASAHLLDGPSELDAAQDIAADVDDAIQTAQASQPTQAVQP